MCSCTSCSPHAPCFATSPARLPCLTHAGPFRNWEIRVANHSDAPTTTRMSDPGYYESLPLCVSDPDNTRPGATIFQVVCSKPVLGQYVIIHLVDPVHNATLALCEVEPFVKNADASGECSAKDTLMRSQIVSGQPQARNRNRIRHVQTAT
jgi:hypothetical protein